MLTGHTGSVLCLQYDDKVIISGSSDATVRVWDVGTGELVNTLIHHCEAVLHLRFAHGMMVTCSKVRLCVGGGGRGSASDHDMIITCSKVYASICMCGGEENLEVVQVSSPPALCWLELCPGRSELGQTGLDDDEPVIQGPMCSM